MRDHRRPRPAPRVPHAGTAPPAGGAPVQRLSLASSDIEQVRAFGGSMFYPRKFLRPLRRSGRLTAQFNVLRVGGLTIGDVRYGADVTLGYEQPDAYQVGVPLAGRLIAHQGGRAIVGAGDQAPVFRVDEDVTLDHWGADCRQLGVKIDPTVLEQQLQTLLDVPIREPIRLPAQLDIADGPGRSWANLIRLTAAEFGADTGLLDHPLLVHRLQDALTAGLLLAVDHPYREHLLRSDQAYRPAPVRRAVDVIHAHPDQPWTVGTLARAAGANVRTLQAGFRRYLGTTPMAYLRHVRLERVHEDLLAADPRETSVADVAHRWGFVHMGRFAGAYRDRYQARPSRTLHGP
ncbi:AraC family transcriptional regulator [Spirilliplanes yamanashiensis]|uniref:AraC family transcriptional regulator n=1 Tax=Spirilliplanes yamanashiensis TaxID=42233 RepID=A0A8J4DMK1_9ACTN|nr:AraC family transcriptional regulator [Spirilliplanes yamanashiensis]MDP9816762.1 AraC-like DNA-binding protein [Spirilliplanes yamanashiensis]GIJ06284.1 AraC family transcriptional regulator [Spirilliplanes yamanashiensis]